ncbi:MAG: alpha-1,2-fucosyltransferase [Spirochaetes bacterium]|nr:alpha-1,2-fucosyltransferase [Spirochaetota bacterium]
MKKIIVRIKGGLGNQLFCYAAARRLALANKAELVIDNVSGFSRDKKYRRQYILDHFNVLSRKAMSFERLEPFERYRRGVIKFLSHRKSFLERSYIEQEGSGFDSRLLDLKVKSSLYLDGLWQSQNYFKDVEEIIRKDLSIIPPVDRENQSMAEYIRDKESVALHVRWFDAPNSNNKSMNNVSEDYYRKAIVLMEKKIRNPHYFVFSDNLELARANICLPEGRVTYVYHNQGDENAYADLWLMSQCQHFIVANSTFSWWGAWLSNNLNKVVVCPNFQNNSLWNKNGLILEKWINCNF